MLARKKAQMIGLDVVLSIIILLLAIGFCYYFLVSQGKSEPVVLSLEENFILVNFRNNLETSTFPFLQDYTIDEAMLTGFASQANINEDFEGYVLNGLGVNNESYDLCIYFENTAGFDPIISGPPAINMLGEVYNDQTHTTRADCNNMVANPCEFYRNVINFVVPVLRNSKIEGMHILICKN